MDSVVNLVLFNPLRELCAVSLRVKESVGLEFEVLLHGEVGVVGSGIDSLNSIISLFFHPGGSSRSSQSSLILASNTFCHLILT